MSKSINPFIPLSGQLSLAGGIAGFLLFCLSMPVWAIDGAIKDIRYDRTSGHFFIDTTGPAKAMVNTLNIAGRKRIIIDVENAEIGLELPRDVQLLQSLAQETPSLKNLTINQYGGNGRPIVRIMLDIQGDTGAIRLLKSQGPHIELQLSGTTLKAGQSDNQSATRPGLDMPSSLSSSGKQKPFQTHPPVPDTARSTTSPNGSHSVSIDELKQTLVILSQKYDFLNRENQNLKTQLATQERTRLDSKEDEARLERARINEQNLRDELERAQKENSKLAHLREENQNLIAQRDRQAATPRETSKNSLATSRLNEELNTLKRSLETKNAEHTQLVAELNAQKGRLTAENERLRKTQGVTTPSLGENKNNPNSADIQTMRKQLTVAQQSLNDSIRVINEQNKEIAYLRNQFGNVKSGVDASSREQINSLQSSLEQKETTIQELQKQLAGRGTASSATQSSVSVKEAMDRLTQENRSLQSMVASLKTTQQKPASSVAESAQTRQLKAQLADMQTALSEAKTAAEKASQESNKARQEVSVLKTGKVDSTLQKQVTELNRQLADVQSENANLRKSLSEKPSTRTPSGTAMAGEAEQHHEAGKAALATKNISQALDEYKEAMLLQPDALRYTLDYSVALAEDHQYAEAIDLLRRYIQKNPNEREAYNQLGKIYLLNDQADAANQAFSRALSITTLNNYATSLKKVNRMAESEMVYKLALSLNPKDSEVLFNLGNLYNAQNKLELARSKYLEAIQLRPDFAEAHYNLGLIFSKMGDNPSAISHLEKYLQLSPNARNAETIRTYLQKLKA